MLESKSFPEPPSLLCPGIPCKGPTEVVHDGNSKEIRNISNFSAAKAVRRLPPLVFVPGVKGTAAGDARPERKAP